MPEMPTHFPEFSSALLAQKLSHHINTYALHWILTGDIEMYMMKNDWC
jgi:hypothetical protein